MALSPLRFLLLATATDALDEWLPWDDRMMFMIAVRPDASTYLTCMAEQDWRRGD
jgi:hypothetical protein